MKIGIIGLGRMGLNIAKRLLKGGHTVVAYNRSLQKVKDVETAGALGVASVETLIDNLEAPRVIWVMLPAGEVTDQHISKLKLLLSRGDLIIDGGNTHYKDDLRRCDDLGISGINYMDVGVSGGIWGLEKGFCLMAGGRIEDFKHMTPAFETLAPKVSFIHCGPIGSGHYVKMVHNGIEYGLMEAYGEGFELLKESPYRESLDLAKISHLWNQGSIIRSWLLELLENVFKEDPDLTKVRGYVEDSGEGRWMVQEAVERGVALNAIALTLFRRFDSRKEEVFSNRILAALRNQFGGHSVKPGKR